MDPKEQAERLQRAVEKTIESFGDEPTGIVQAVKRLKGFLRKVDVSYWRQVKGDVFFAGRVRSGVRSVTDEEGQRVFESTWVEKEGKKTREWGSWKIWTREQFVQFRDENRVLALKYRDKVKWAEARIEEIDRQQQLPGMGNGD